MADEGFALIIGNTRAWVEWLLEALEAPGVPHAARVVRLRDGKVVAWRGAQGWWLVP